MDINDRGEILELVEDKLFLLQNIVKLDGRLIAFPPNQTGFAPLNCYILKEDTGAFMNLCLLVMLSLFLKNLMLQDII